MKSENKSSPSLDLVAGLVSAFLLLAIVIAVWIGSQSGIRVTTELTTQKGVGPFETITVRFSEAVDGSLAIKKFSIQPSIDGSFRWDDPRTLQFVPRTPFQPDTTYTLKLDAGVLTTDGRLLKKSRVWNFQVRTPLVVYLLVEGTQSRLWTLDPAGGKSTLFTDDKFRVISFDAADSGEFVIFAALNEQQGMDLWKIGRDGGTPALLLECGVDRCSVPAISFFDRRVAYVREAAAGLGAALQYGAPRIWVLDLETGQDAPLYEDQQIIGSRPAWSPDGTRLSSFDGMADELRLLDIVTGNQLIIPSQTGSPVTWSADGNTFVYTDVVTTATGLSTRVREAKLTTQEIVTMLGEKDDVDYHYNSLAWSPADDRLVVGLRTDPKSPAESLWLMDPATLGGQMIADQPDYIYSNPIWDPWGKALVFQQFNVKEPYSSEIGMWMPGFKQPQVIAKGILPLWLP